MRHSYSFLPWPLNLPFFHTSQTLSEPHPHSLGSYYVLPVLTNEHLPRLLGQPPANSKWALVCKRPAPCALPTASQSSPAGLSSCCPQWYLAEVTCFAHWLVFPGIIILINYLHLNPSQGLILRKPKLAPNRGSCCLFLECLPKSGLTKDTI